MALSSGWHLERTNPLNAELNPICYLLALLGAHHFLHVSRIRVKSLTLRLLMSYIYIYMEHPFLLSLDHTQRRSTVGRTPLDEWSARRRDLYLTKTTLTIDKYPCPRWDSNPRSQQASGPADLETSRMGALYIYDISSLRVKSLSCI